MYGSVASGGFRHKETPKEILELYKKFSDKSKTYSDLDFKLSPNIKLVGEYKDFKYETVPMETFCPGIKDILLYDGQFHFDNLSEV